MLAITMGLARGGRPALWEQGSRQLDLKPRAPHSPHEDSAGSTIHMLHTVWSLNTRQLLNRQRNSHLSLHQRGKLVAWNQPPKALDISESGTSP